MKQKARKEYRMKIFDMHVHAANTPPEQERLLSQLEAAGVYGCSVYSTRPREFNKQTGVDFDTRLSEVLAWSCGHEERIIPVLWVHPDEENILEKEKTAVDSGVAAFKIICNNFYVGENKSMDLLEKIGELDRPVIFHSGILWDGAPSSLYNRPANWEALLELKSLRFSLAHCSWPWIDECIAVYGKFLNALSHGKNVEIFLDLTPGTPEMYREELFRKLFYIGYDVPNNIMYGTDCSVKDYNSEWTKKWLKIDNELFDKLGIPEKLRKKIFCDNFMRFIGKSSEAVNRFVPLPDSQTMWTPDLEK